MLINDNVRGFKILGKNCGVDVPLNAAPQTVATCGPTQSSDLLLAYACTNPDIERQYN